MTLGLLGSFWLGKGRHRETRLEATVTVQARDDGDLVQGGRYAGGEKQLDPGYILEIKILELDMRCERSRGIKENASYSHLEDPRSRMELPSLRWMGRRVESPRVLFGPC